MQIVIDELLIGIVKETLSLRSVEVHPFEAVKSIAVCVPRLCEL